jgi:hypothetical protein
MYIYNNRFHENLPKETAWLPEQQAEADKAESLDSRFIISPIGFLTETLLATEEYWEALPGLTPPLLREALAELLAVAP